MGSPVTRTGNSAGILVVWFFIRPREQNFSARDRPLLSHFCHTRPQGGCIQQGRERKLLGLWERLRTEIGAGEGNRTLVSGLGSPRSTIEPHPPPRGFFYQRPPPRATQELCSFDFVLHELSLSVNCQKRVVRGRVLTHTLWRADWLLRCGDRGMRAIYGACVSTGPHDVHF